MADTTNSSKRVSRYRSQRRAQQQQEEEAPEVPPIPQDDAPADNTPVRTRSRYHRKNNATNQRPATAYDQDRIDVPSGPKPQSPPTLASWPLTANSSQHQRTNSAARRYHERHSSPPAQLGATDEREVNVDADGYGFDNARIHYANGHSVECPTTATKRDARPALPPSHPSAELFPPSRSEPTRPAAKPVILDGPPSSDKITATKSMSQLPKYPDDEEGGGGCFGLFKRKRGEASPGDVEKKPIARAPQALQDVPVSAVNSGERRVLVECGKSKTIFPVSPDTTTVDLIKSAANCMSERINVRSAVLLELFGSVGVQRPLRRYEHAWDVMNSWDTDGQNNLLLVDPGTGSSEIELSIAGVPRKKPGDLDWLMTYSQKVGKWDKRTVTLRPDGQIIVQKEPSKPQQVDSICHLSDFDIYTPTQEKARKKIKPPKKHCFAIKSQQKSIMFETTQNFVHFFCTSDPRVAEEFYAAVQGWRSWYLVNVLDEGKKSSKGAVGKGVEKEVGEGFRAHKAGESFDSHSQLGSFKPLLDVEQFDQRPSTAKSANGPTTTAGGFAKSANQFDPMVSPERRMSTKKKQHPPLALGNKVLADDEPLANLGRRASLDQKRVSVDNARREEFAAKGSLGRSYSLRQREGAEKESHKQQQALVAGPDLLSGGVDGDGGEYAMRRQSLDAPPHRNKSTRARPAQQKPSTNGNGTPDVRRNKSTRNPGSGDLGRSNSTRAAKEMPKPLVDLSPQYQEPSQHIKKGKGHRPDEIGPGGLIEAATGPEDPIGAPPRTYWRGRNGQTSSPGAAGVYPGGSRHGRARSRSTSRPGQRLATSRSPHEEHGGAFTGEGLMAGRQAQSGWGGGDRGRGVVDGSRARGPLLDVREESRFAPGSLMERVEREGGRQGVVIDRGEEG